MANPDSKNSIYQEIIDQLVNKTQISSVCAKRALNNTPFPNGAGERIFN